jgi:hypothetical protein
MPIQLLCWHFLARHLFWPFFKQLGIFEIFISAYMTAIFTFSMYSVSVTPSITKLCHYADPALMLALFGLAIILAIFQTIGHF